MPKIQDIDWTRFRTAYGPADEVGELLEQLFGADKHIAKAASHQLWCGLCHQHAYVSSAALPALPFILKAMESGDKQLTIEMLDILYGFATCTSDRSLAPWEVQLRAELRTALPRVESLCASPNQDIRDFAELFVANVGSENRQAPETQTP